MEGATDYITPATACHRPRDRPAPTPESLHDIVRIATLATQERNPFDELRKTAFRAGADDDTGIDRAQLESLLEETRAGKDAMLNAVCG